MRSIAFRAVRSPYRFVPDPRRPYATAHVNDPRLARPAPVSRRSLVVLEGAYYSMPCEWNGLDVMAHVGAEDILFVGPTGEIRHPRKRLGQKPIEYRHYVRELARKPQAVRQVAAELVRDLGEPFPTVWRALVDEHGPVQASRILAKVLDQVERRGLAEVAEVVTQAHRRGLAGKVGMGKTWTEASGSQTA